MSRENNVWIRMSGILGIAAPARAKLHGHASCMLVLQFVKTLLAPHFELLRKASKHHRLGLGKPLGVQVNLRTA
jgi:hypothetical protein